MYWVGGFKRVIPARLGLGSIGFSLHEEVFLAYLGKVLEKTTRFLYTLEYWGMLEGSGLEWSGVSLCRLARGRGLRQLGERGKVRERREVHGTFRDLNTCMDSFGQGI